jgi:hypothetical protein
MEKKNNSLRRTVSSSVLFGFLAILLFAPNVRADLVVQDGQTENIDYAVGDYLEIYGTANLYPGASALFNIFAYPGKAADDPGSTVNIHGCAPGNTLTVLKKGDIGGRLGLPPVVTIYGSSFQIGTGPSLSPPIDQAINGTLNVLDEFEEVLFSLWIFSDVDIHLRAPGSEEEEKERLEAELWVSPTKIYRHRTRPVVFATLRLPEGITKDDVDSDYRLVLYAGDNEVGIEARCQRIYQSCRRRKTSRVKIFAFFNMGTLLEALPENCEEMQLQVCGRLKTGQEFYGSKTIRIINPRKRHYWRRRIFSRLESVSATKSLLGLIA